jgi:hypothetical protein
VISLNLKHHRCCEIAGEGDAVMALLVLPVNDLQRNMFHRDRQFVCLCGKKLHNVDMVRLVRQ